MSDKLPFDVDLDRSALLVVDMQNDFVRAGAPLEVPDARQTIAPIRLLIEAFRNLNRPVIFTRFVAGGTPSVLWIWSPQIHDPVNCCKIGHRRSYGDVQGERECIAVIDEFDVRENDAVVDKYWYGAFFRTNLKDILLSHNVDTVAVTGTVTQICVEDTARQAFHEGFKVIVLEDCVSSFAPDLHRATLKNIGMKFGAVLNSRDFLQTTGEASRRAA